MMSTFASDLLRVEAGQKEMRDGQDIFTHPTMPKSPFAVRSIGDDNCFVAIKLQITIMLCFEGRCPSRSKCVEQQIWAKEASVSVPSEYRTGRSKYRGPTAACEFLADNCWTVALLNKQTIRDLTAA